MSLFVCDGKGSEVKEITPLAGWNYNHCYVLPEKHLALERGEGSRFLQESSLGNVTTLTYSALPPIDYENLEYQLQYKRVNRNLKIFVFFWVDTHGSNPWCGYF